MLYKRWRKKIRPILTYPFNNDFVNKKLVLINFSYCSLAVYLHQPGGGCCLAPDPLGSLHTVCVPPKLPEWSTEVPGISPICLLNFGRLNVPFGPKRCLINVNTSGNMMCRHCPSQDLTSCFTNFLSSSKKKQLQCHSKLGSISAISWVRSLIKLKISLWRKTILTPK